MIHKSLLPLSVLLLSTLLLLLSSCADKSRQSEAYKESAKRAKYLYDAERYEEAIDEIHNAIGIAANEKVTFYEMYNLGNAYYRNGDLGEAILYYERALRLNPRDEAVKHNLMIANSRTIDRIDYHLPFLKQAWRSICFLLPSGWLFTLSIVLWILAVAGILLYIFGAERLYRQLGFYSALVTLALAGLSFFMIASVRKQFRDSSAAIVTVGQIAIKSAPNDSAKTLFLLNEGSKVAIIGEITDGGAWLQATLPDGKAGWIQAATIERVFPFTSRKPSKPSHAL